MTAAILNGEQLAQTLRAELKAEVARFTQQTGARPGLAAVLIGDNDASQRYVRSKRKACEEVGIASWLHDRPAAITQSEVLNLIAQLNADRQVSGILVQMPLPKHIDEAAIVDAVDPQKDIDGFGPVSLGLLAAGRPRFLACTPYGVMQILARNGISVRGKDVVIVGRSNIVGRPLSLMLGLKPGGGMDGDATVTVCHSRTPDIATHTRRADVVVMAIGQANYLKADMVKPGAVVIDVGINRRPSDGKLTGDVDFDGVSQVASAITPVPRGVGPMTIAMLLHNTLKAARLQAGGAS